MRSIQVAWLWGFLQPRLLALAGVLALALISTALGVLTPWITKHIIDDGLIAGSVSSLQGWVAAMIGVTVCSALLSAFNRRTYLALSSDMLMRMRSEVFGHLGRLSPDFYQRWRQGELFSRLDGDIGEVQRFAIDSLLAAVNGLLALVGVLVLMWWLSPTLTSIAFILLPVSILFLRVMRPRLEVQTRQLRERATDVSSLLVDRMPNMLLLQSFRAVSGTLGELDHLQAHYRQQLLRSQMLGYWVATVPALFNTLATAAVFIIGGRGVIDGSLSLGTLIAFASYLGRATGPVNTLLGIYVAAQRAGVSLSRVQQLLDEQPATQDPAVPTPLQSDGGSLQFDAMNFTQRGDTQPLWQPLSIVIPAGARVWVSGASGAGKSTLLNLLQRHNDPTAGSIALDNIRLPELSLSELRQAIVLLQQEAPMLDVSVRDNLCLGRTSTDTELHAALDRAELRSWYASLPDGLDTRLGNRATRLSGGERHRLALARVLLQQPQVILFDETTSALDDALEATIWSMVDRLFTEQTLIIVSHRAPPLQHLSHELKLTDRQWQWRALP